MSEFTFTDQNFEKEVLGSDQPVLVDFWAPWCGPCKIQGPIVDELAKELKNESLKIGKLNVDENPQMASKFQIMSIPTIVVFKNGKPIQQMLGVHDKKTLKEKLVQLIEK